MVPATFELMEHQLGCVDDRQGGCDRFRLALTAWSGGTRDGEQSAPREQHEGQSRRDERSLHYCTDPGVP